MTLNVAIDVANGRLPYFIDKHKEEHKQTVAKIKEYKKVSAEETANSCLYTHPRDERWYDTSVVSLAKDNLVKARRLALPVEHQDRLSNGYGRWHDWASSMSSLIEGIHTPIEALRCAQQRVPFDHRAEVENQFRLYEIYEALLTNEFPCFDMHGRVFDEPESVPDTLFYPSKGKCVSDMYYWHLRTMYSCLALAGKVRRITEIGGGYGALARLWLLNDIAPIERYVIVDIPESLFFSEVYLRTVFGDDVHYSMDGKSDGRIVLIPVGGDFQFEAPPDLVINVGSLQEMSDSWVDFWMLQLDSMGSKYFYSLNYVGQSHVHYGESRNYWAPRPSIQWATNHISATVPLVDMMCPSRTFCETLYERRATTMAFTDWSALKGSPITRASYIEGLELVRQTPTMENIQNFVRLMMSHRVRVGHFRPYKELYYLAHALLRAGDETMRETIEFYDGMRPVITA